MSLELKIKSKHLSVEAQIIRFEEHKLTRQIRWYAQTHRATGSNEEPNFAKFAPSAARQRLHEHRVRDVRRENRATFLARAYIAGAPYKTVEQRRKHQREFEFHQFIIPRIVNMVARYGTDKVPVKIFDRTRGVYIDNPELARITQAVIEWIETTE